MEPLIFQHTFSNGGQITMRIDRTGDVPRFSSNRIGTKVSDAEYRAWRNEVFNTLYEHLTDEEKIATAIYGQQCK